MNWMLRVALSIMIVGSMAAVASAPASTPVALAAPSAQEACSRPNEPPPPVPGDPSTASFWGRYRVPLPPAEVYRVLLKSRPVLPSMVTAPWLTRAPSNPR